MGKCRGRGLCLPPVLCPPISVTWPTHFGYLPRSFVLLCPLISVIGPLMTVLAWAHFGRWFRAFVLFAPLISVT
jgi:hypothetical protein